MTADSLERSARFCWWQAAATVALMLNVSCGGEPLNSNALGEGTWPLADQGGGWSDSDPAEERGAPLLDPPPRWVGAGRFTGFLGGDGRIHWAGPTYTGHAPLLGGAPQQGYDYGRLPGAHWANDAQRWVVRTNDANNYGFRNDLIGQQVVVQLRSHPDDGSNSYHQNDGWFRFKVHVSSADHDEISFQLALESELGQNHWFSGEQGCWDWMVFRPMFRAVGPQPGAVPGPWQRTDEPEVAGGDLNAREPRASFTIPLHQFAEHSLYDEYYVEIGQGLPYTLEERNSFFDANALADRAPEGVAVDKIDLGDNWQPAYGGLAALPSPYGELNELYGIAIYREAGFANDIVLVTAGVHYEPPSMFVLEGLVEEILEHPDVLDRVSFVLIPAANPDGYAWTNAHVRPYGDGVGELENGAFWFAPYQHDPEAFDLRDYVNHLYSDVQVNFVAHFDLHADLAPHPNRWKFDRHGKPPTYGYLYTNSLAAEQRTTALINRLRQEPYSGSYIRPLDLWPTYSSEADPVTGCHHGDLPLFFQDRGVPVRVVFEYDETALYRAINDPPPPAGLPGLPTGDPLLLREPSDDPGDPGKQYWVDGTIDDPIVYRQWGRELLRATMYAFAAPDQLIGDVNGDGVISAGDAQMAFYIALGMIVPSADEEYRADANRDGLVSSGDASCIYYQALGIPNDCFE